MRALMVLATGLLAFGCSKPAVSAYQNFSDEKVDAQLIKPPPPGAPAPTRDGSATGPELAYAHQFGLEAPPRRVRGLLARHQAACAAAGFAACVVTASTVEEQGRDNVHATLSLRATPGWVTNFAAGLAKDARDADGRVVRAAVTSEDLSTQIIDSQAALKARTTLRDRLQAILASRPGKTADLIEAETALAKVQGELDANQSELAAMKQRVATSVVDIDYASQGMLAPEGAWSPLTSAIDQFVRTIAVGTGALITIFAFLLPWALAIGVVWWLLRKRLRGLRWPWRRRSGA